MGTHTIVEVQTAAGTVELASTPDNGRTRLVLTVAGNGGAAMELTAGEVRSLAGELLEWLFAHDHPMPDAPVGYVLAELNLEPDEDEEEDGRPPAPDRFGELQVAHLTDPPGVRIDRADAWILMSPVLWDTLANRENRWCSADGELLTVRDSIGTVVSYLRRSDLVPPTQGLYVLEQQSYGCNSPVPTQPATGTD